MFVIKTKKRVVASRCYAGRQDLGCARLRNHGIAENWLRFATPDARLQTMDNGQQTTVGGGHL